MYPPFGGVGGGRLACVRPRSWNRRCDLLLYVPTLPTPNRRNCRPDEFRALRLTMFFSQGEFVDAMARERDLSARKPSAVGDVLPNAAAVGNPRDRSVRGQLALCAIARPLTVPRLVAITC